MYRKACTINIPVWEKASLSIVEAAGYSGIGQTKLRQLVSREDCPFALWVGRKCLIKRKQFDEYLNNAYSI